MRRILIVGGGVIGTSVAWHVAERGLGEVTLIERDRLGSGTTWHSAGNITWKPVPDSDVPIEYMLELIPRLEREAGQSTGWLRTGRLYIARSPEAMGTFEGYARAAETSGRGGILLAPGEVSRHHPLAAGDAIVGAWLNPLSGRLNPADLVAAYARAARRRGVRIEEQCTVRGLIRRGARVCGLESERGTFEADDVVIAAGLWSRGLLAQAGLRAAHGACEHFYAIAAPSPALRRETPSFICPEDLIYGREEVGGFLVGFFDRNAKCLDAAALPEPFTFTLLDEDWDQVATYYERACEIFPALVDAPIRRLVNGPESFTVDGRPLVGPVEGVDGLFLACAMNSSGVTFSGMVGHSVADWLAGEELRFREFDCRPERFGERESDPAWVDAQMPHAPSNFYQVHNTSAL